MKHHLLRLLLIFMLLIAAGNGYGQSVGWQWAIGPSRTDSGQNEMFYGSIDDSGNTFSVACSTFDHFNYGSFVSRNIPHWERIIFTKVDTSGNIRWVLISRYAMAVPIRLVCDHLGNSYLYGRYWGDSCKFGSMMVYNTHHTNASFLAKISPAGIVLWAQNIMYTAGASTGMLYQPAGMGIDGQANIYIDDAFGNTSTFDSFTLTTSGAADLFLAKFDSAGNFVWARDIGGTNGEFVGCLAVSEIGNVYLSGTTTSDTLIIARDTLIDSFTTAGFRTHLLFLAKYDSSGGAIWVRIPGLHFGIAELKLDAVEKIYFAGGFDSTIVFGHDTLTIAGGGDALIGKFDSSGHDIWARSGVSTSRYGRANNISLDSCRHVLVTGFMCISCTIADSMTFQGHVVNIPSGYVSDAMFIVEYDYLGNYITSMSVGSGGDDYCGILIDNRGNFTLAGDYIGQLELGTDTLFAPSGYTGGSEVMFNAKYHYGLESCVFHDSVSHNDSGTLVHSLNAYRPSKAKLFPNPAGDKCLISIDGTISGDGMVGIFSLTGQLIHSAKLTGSQTIIDLNALNPGIYLCRVSVKDDDSVVIKLVVSR